MFLQLVNKVVGDGIRDGNCQERCHLLEAFYADSAKVTWRLVFGLLMVH